MLECFFDENEGLHVVRGIVKDKAFGLDSFTMAFFPTVVTL